MKDATDLPGRPCAAASALSIVGEKWALLAVRELMFGNHRFDAIARNTGAPRDRLTARLRALEEAGVVERRPYSERPPRYEYHLTESGRALAPVVQSLVQWGDRWARHDHPTHLRHDCGADLSAEWVCTACGKPADYRHTHVESGAPGWDRAGPVLTP